MNNIKNENQKYSWFTCMIFVVFGFVCLIGCIAEAYFLFTGSSSRITAIATTGFLAYIFIYTGYKGKAPKWFNDEDIFHSKEK